jgi:cysteine sulfinate desulfinase/cysteine desulfurase-like protein
MAKILNLDTNGSKKIPEKVIEKYLNDTRKFYYNPSNTILPESQYENDKIEDVKKYFLKLFDFDKDDIIVFTSGATEGNNMIINYLLNRIDEAQCVSKKCKILYDNFAHSSIKIPLKHNACKIKLNVNDTDKELIKKYTEHECDAIFLNAVDSVSGRKIPYNKIFKQFPNSIKILDFSQAMLLHKFNTSIDADVIVFTGYKFGAMQNTGAILIKKSLKLTPLIQGMQQNGLRGGTIHYPMIHSLKIAMKEKFKIYTDDHIDKLDKLRKELVQKLNLKINYPSVENVVMISFDHCTRKIASKLALEHKVYVGIGSACETEKTSQKKTGVIRLSFDKTFDSNRFIEAFKSSI